MASVSSTAENTAENQLLIPQLLKTAEQFCRKQSATTYLKRPTGWVPVIVSSRLAQVGSVAR